MLFFLVTLKHYLNEVVNGFKVEEVVVRDVNTNAEVEASVPRNLIRTDLRLTNLPRQNDLEYMFQELKFTEHIKSAVAAVW